VGIGGHGRARTFSFLFVGEALYPLSYAPLCSPVLGNWWSRQDSNLRPPVCKTGALPIELQPHDCMFRRSPALVADVGIEPT
jgi:hypothetical protein